MTCVCGHNKSEHQYEQDTQSKTGLCEHSTQMIFRNAKKHCGCHQYKKILGEGKDV